MVFHILFVYILYEIIFFFRLENDYNIISEMEF